MDSVYSASPSLSTSTGTTKLNSNGPNKNNPLNYNYGELFEDVDWQAVNLIDIEKDWREELDQLEKVHSPLGILLFIHN